MKDQSFFAMDAPYARAMNWLWNIIVISTLWVVCCIPVVTIGASCTAAYYTAAKVIRGKEGSAAREFFHAFRNNWKQSAFFSVIYTLVLAVVLLECFYLYHEPTVSLSVLYVFYGMTLLVIANIQYLFPCMSRFSMGKFELFRMATLLSIRHLISTILLLVLFVVCCVAVYLMPWGIFIFPGLMYLAKTYLMERILRKSMPEPEDEDEKQKWYYNI